MTDLLALLTGNPIISKISTIHPHIHGLQPAHKVHPTLMTTFEQMRKFRSFVSHLLLSAMQDATQYASLLMNDIKIKFQRGLLLITTRQHVYRIIYTFMVIMGNDVITITDEFIYNIILLFTSIMHSNIIIILLRYYVHSKIGSI